MILGYKWTNFREIFPFQKKKKKKNRFSLKIQLIIAFNT